MKKKPWQRIACLICAITLCASALAGCGGNNTSSTGDSSQTSSSSTESKEDSSSGGESSEASGGETGIQTAEGFNKEGLPILNEKKTYEVYIGQMGTLKPANETQANIDTTADTNVEINWVEVPLASWSEKVNVLLASQTLPDAFCGNAIDLASYGDMFLRLNEYMDEFAPVTKKFFDDHPTYYSSSADSEGNIKMLPTGDEYLGNTIDAQLWINKDWLDTLKLEIPTTTDEFVEVLRAFKTKDPNGNGEADEIPYTFREVWGWAAGMENMFGPFGVVENDNHVFLDPKDGKTVVFSAEEQGYYDALEWMHSLYAEGLLDSECFTHSSDQYYTKNTGKDIIGSYNEYGDGGLGTFISDTHGDEVNPETDEAYRKFVHVPALKGPNGDQIVGLNNLNRDTGLYITTKCEEPEALVRWYDYVNSSLDTKLKFRTGKENEVWYYTDEVDPDDPFGHKIPMTKYLIDPDDYKQFGYNNSSEYSSNEAFAGWSPALSYYEKDQKIKADGGAGDYIKLPAAKIDVEFGVQPLPPGVTTIENQEQRGILKADIDNYLLRFISDSIVNGIDESKWNEHLSQLEKLRVPEYKQLCQEFVDEIQARMN